jgi:hypothetical protein
MKMPIFTQNNAQRSMLLLATRIRPIAAHSQAAYKLASIQFVVANEGSRIALDWVGVATLSTSLEPIALPMPAIAS